MAICRCTHYTTSSYCTKVFHKTVFPAVQDTAFVTEQTLHHIIISTMPAVNYRSFTRFNHYIFLFQMHEYYSISPIFPFYLKTRKKGKMDSHANGQDQEKHTGQRHACTHWHVKLLFQTSPPLKYHFKSTSGASPLCSSL